jgi:hypothetical protein
MTGTAPHTWRADLMDDITFVGLDAHKATVCVAVDPAGLRAAVAARYDKSMFWRIALRS